MELFEKELILPGVITEIISDYASGYDTSLFGTTDSVAIVGTAFNGPVGVPVEVYSPEHARYMFGDSYDSKTKREATLVSNIQDAWDRGCRTIYAVRVSGKEIYKDYAFAIDTDLRLRMSGIFPSNLNKDLSMILNLQEQALYVKIIKPASRATINEKSQGLVEKLDSVIVNELDLTNIGLTLDSELVELINTVNKHVHNNVIRLTIVDGKGNDVTMSSTDAKGLKIRDLFSGLYTIGRVESVGIPNTVLKVYAAANGDINKELELNSDVSAEYPIFGKTKQELSKYLPRKMVELYDFAFIPGAMDDIFLKDSIDYEEVNLTEFDLYKKLGSGFAINAGVFEGKGGRHRVKELNEGHDAKKIEFRDGIYSMLENLKAKYRVLGGVSADSKIKNRLPKVEEFQKVISVEELGLDGKVTIKTVVDSERAVKKYDIELKHDKQEIPADIAEKLVVKSAKFVSTLDQEDLAKPFVDYKEGSLFYDSETDQELYIVRNRKLVKLHEEAVDKFDGNLIIAENKLLVCKSNKFQAATQEDLNTEIEDAAYIMGLLENGTAMVVRLTSAGGFLAAPAIEVTAEDGKVSEAPKTVKKKARRGDALGQLTLEVLGTAAQVFRKGEKVLTSFTTNYGETANKVYIYSNDFDILTVEEAVEILNEDKDFSKIFNITLNDFDLAQEIVEDATEELTKTGTIEADREVIVDKNVYIPYRTDDNFARHLAQHCMYTSLKTAPTHGIIGTKILLDTGLTSIANRVVELAKSDIASTLVAKKGNGTDMLDRNNLPYPIGRKVSITFGQYININDDGHSFVSNMSAGYAGMVSQLPLDQSSTSQPIDIPEPMFQLTNSQLSMLSKAGFVTTNRSYSKGHVITDGVTMAPANSPFKRLSACRIADGIEGVIRTVCEPFIGKTNNLANQNSLRSAIKSELDKLSGVLIEDYEFRLITDKSSMVLGILNIEYAIIPLYEIRQIRNHITVK